MLILLGQALLTGDVHPALRIVSLVVTGSWLLLQVKSAPVVNKAAVGSGAVLMLFLACVQLAFLAGQ